jgi:hypothetical protein
MSRLIIPPPPPSSPSYTTGAVSSDNGSTWTYDQQPPASAIAAKAPSGALPLIQAAWAASIQWAQSVASGLDLNPLFIQDDVDWGSFDPSTDITPGFGLGGSLPVGGEGNNDGEPVLSSVYAGVFAAGFTLVHTITAPAVTGSDVTDFRTGIEWADYPDYDTDYFTSTCTNYGAETDTGTFEISGDGESASAPIPIIATSGTHKVVITATPSEFKIWIDGGNAIVAPNVIYTPDTPPTTIAIQAGNGQNGSVTATVKCFIATTSIYAPQSDADSKTLSEV